VSFDFLEAVNIGTFNFLKNMLKKSTLIRSRQTQKHKCCKNSKRKHKGIVSHTCAWTLQENIIYVVEISI
jgi:hypothetical protein